MKEKTIAVVWKADSVSGKITVKNAKVKDMKTDAGDACASDGSYNVSTPSRLVITFGNAHLGVGAHSALATVRTEDNAFSFFVRDVNSKHPIWIPEYGVAVTSDDDSRSYLEIASDIHAAGAVSELQQIEAEPEETFEAACETNLDLECPVWLALGRDVRIFQMQPARDDHFRTPFGYWGTISPRYHSDAPADNETFGPARVNDLYFCLGRGSACKTDITRRLEEGVLPILTSVQKDKGISYNLTSFATLENDTLSEDAVKGTEWMLAYCHTDGNMLNEEGYWTTEDTKPLKEREKKWTEETVLCCIRVKAVNTGNTPEYAWFKALHCHCAERFPKGTEGIQYDAKKGASEAAGLVFGINKINGKPMPQEEMAILLQPGETAVMEMIVPHQATSKERAEKLLSLDFDKHLKACRKYWRDKLESGAQISVPETAIDERIRAGLLHLDIATLGEQEGPALATVGWYAPIGSESSPIIQFFDSMGWHKLAERCIQFFCDRQKDDGYMCNFARYELETGGAIWTLGEHYRYTKDKKWLETVKPNILKACEFMLEWRNRNRKEEFKGKGYGLQEGKMADPDDKFHAYFLNALAYLGIVRSAEILEDIDPKNAARLREEAVAYREDIRTSFQEATEIAPVIPTGDGTWVPSVAPWADSAGSLALYAEGGSWHTHGGFGCRDSLIGPLYLILADCLDADEVMADFLVRAQQELYTVKNAGLSQPYYVRHDYAHIKRGEVKAFLKAFYNQVTALQDREAYTFWEHYFHASQHKTHEEGWFLMQIRWMLWLEDGNSLNLLSAIPSKWMEDGKKIELKNVASHFGPLNLEVKSKLVEKQCIKATIECTERPPESVSIRIPHPQGQTPVSVKGGTYDAATETVCVKDFSGKAKVKVRY